MKSTCCARLGGAHRCLERIARAVEVTLQLADGQVAPQHHFVADDDAADVDVRGGQLDRGGQLLLVLVAVVVDPGAEHHVQVVLLGEFGDVRERGLDAVAAHRAHLAAQQRQVRVDLRIGREQPVRRVFVGAERREGQPLDGRRPGRFLGGPVQVRPHREGDGGEHRRDQQARDRFHVGREAATRCRCWAWTSTARPVPALRPSAAARWKCGRVSARRPCARRAAA